MKSLTACVVALFIVLDVSSLPAKTPYNRAGKPASNSFPSFDDVKQTVEEHFAATRGYESGDLVTTSSVNSLFVKLEKMNWKVGDRKEILKNVVSDGDWMARQFATRDGKKFMRQIADLPNGYDRVDRFRRMPYGERRVLDMIHGPDGSKMIEYMTTTKEGKNLGRMVSQGVNGQDFNKPTGKIYTELDLLKRLKRSYESEAKRHLSGKPSPGSKSSDSSKGETDEPADGAKQPPAKPEVDPFDRRFLPHG